MARLDVGGAPPLRAVICVLHDSGPLLPALAVSLRPQLEAERWRVVLVDSGSSDGSPELAARLLPGSEVLVLDGNRGFAAGINAGVRHVQRQAAALGRPLEGLVVLNPDVTPRQDCLDATVDALDPTAGVGITAPRLVDEHGRLQHSLRRPPTARAALAEGLLGGVLAARLGLPTVVIRSADRYARRDDDAAWATGGLLAFSPETFALAGPWNEDYFLYEEEVEFCLRARDAGLRLRYLPEVEAVRFVGDAPVTPWAESLMRTNRVRHMRRRSGAGAAAAHFAANLLGVTLRAGRGRAEARAARDSLLRMLSPSEVMRRYAAPPARRPGTDGPPA